MKKLFTAAVIALTALTGQAQAKSSALEVEQATQYVALMGMYMTECKGTLSKESYKSIIVITEALPAQVLKHIVKLQRTMADAGTEAFCSVAKEIVTKAKSI